MKLKRKLSLILCLIFALFLTTNYGEVEAKAETMGKPVLTVKSTDADNYVHLNWTSPDKDKYYSYRLFSKESGKPIFQSIPSKEKVKVLNVYPGKDSNGKIVGDNLKGWMENPNPESSNGYGKGLISVDKVSIDEFNTNAASILKDSSGNYKYDVIYEGAWDCHNTKDLSENAEKEIENFIDTGRGYLGGHDTFWYYSNVRNKLSNYLNIIPNISQAYGATSVKINKKGLLTNYPWSIGEIGSQLTVPMSHSSGQYAFGDIWIKYTKNTWSSDPETNIYNGKACTNNFYLTTWNNTAMIQTGHSSGAATPDEQKVLANTLFYLAQVSEDTKWDDHKGQDLKAPTKPNIKSVNKNSSNKLEVAFDKSEDVGSSYDYYVEAKEKATGKTVNSDVKSTAITSGLKGYSVVVDQNENTVPKNEVTTTSTNITVDSKYDSDFYVHVAAIDNVGNISEVSTYKYVYPTLTLTAGDLNAEKNTVTIKAEGKGIQSPIKEVTLPNGKTVEGSNAEFTVDVNGNYTFSAVDNEGNKVSKDIKIDKVPGSIDLEDIEVNDDKASTTLNWINTDKTQDYSYNINSKKSDEEEFTSVPVKETAYKDDNAKDVTAPEEVEIKEVRIAKAESRTVINFSESKDKGTSYDYYIDAKASKTGIESKSEIKSATVTSGLKGYSIVVDQNKDTVPDGSITTTSTNYVFDKLYKSDFYVHVAAVDNAGNMSGVSTFKYSYPVLKLTPNTTKNVKDKVIITAEASSEGNSIEKIITPDGKEVSGDKAEYTAIEDKVYVFKAIDSNGNTVEASIDIENITADVILNAEPETHKLRIDENFAVTLNVDHVCNIGTVDLIVKYDSSKLKLLGATKIPGIIYYGDKLNEGEYRITLTTSPAALISSKNNLIKLHFRTLAPGKVDINVTKGRVSDGETEILRNCECGGTTVEIVDRKLKAMTLNDIFIISQHAGEDPEKLYPAIDADLNLDGKIDKADVDKAYKLMLQNPNENM